jgi:hypothetical protein
LRDTKKWKVDSNSARKNQVCSPIKPLAAEKKYNFAGLCFMSFCVATSFKKSHKCFAEETAQLKTQMFISTEKQ